MIGKISKPLLCLWYFSSWKIKTFSYSCEQMILNNWNVLIVDPKGGKGQEILSWIIEFAGEAGRTEDLF